MGLALSFCLRAPQICWLLIRLMCPHSGSVSRVPRNANPYFRYQDIIGIFLHRKGEQGTSLGRMPERMHSPGDEDKKSYQRKFLERLGNRAKKEEDMFSLDKCKKDVKFQPNYS